MLLVLHLWGISCSVKSASMSGEEATYLHQFHTTHPGTFVEVGAYDGHMFSNTRQLSKCFGWKGLLIEANIDNYANLIKRLDRPNIVAKHSAICEPPQRWTRFTLDGGAVSTDVSRVSSSFQRKWSSFNHPNYTAMIPCAPMSELLGDIRHVHYFSIDVEGAEWTAVTTIDFNITQIDTFSIELDRHNRRKNTNIISFLQSKGYAQCRTQDKRNGWFQKQCPTKQ